MSRLAVGRGREGEPVVATGQDRALQAQRVEHRLLVLVVIIGMHLGEVEHGARQEHAPGARDITARDGHADADLLGEVGLAAILLGRQDVDAPRPQQILHALLAPDG